jgi:hypothetical protein
MEQYICFSIDKLMFLDSFLFMSASLETLVSNLLSSDKKKFENMYKIFDEDKVDLLLRKGIYPYSYMDSLNKMNEISLPSKESFYNDLKKEHISNEDYIHAKKIWSLFDIKNMGEYHDLYLLCDVVLLADCFENYRNMGLEYFGLDPANYLTAPSFFHSCMLKMTEVKIELLQDIDMYLFLEDGIRGGLSLISNRYGCANNKYMSNYDCTQPSKFIMNYDFNNLYGLEMKQYLPISDYKWLENNEIEKFDIEKTTDDSDKGYILCVDLEYPNELHNYTSDYPLAVEKFIVKEDMLSNYTKEILKKLYNNKKYKTCEKLVPTLFNKTKYIVHYRTLKLYVELGLKIIKIHKILEFTQSPWLYDFVSFCTTKRIEAKNELIENMWKDAVNCNFGKMLECLRKRVLVEIVTDIERLIKLIAKPTFVSFKIFTEDVVAVHMKKKKILLNKPIIVGFCILDLAKLEMYSFYYKYLKKTYDNNVKLLATDTDSFIIEVETDDIFLDIYNDRELFDTSNFPKDHYLYTEKNRRVVGKMKSEFSNIIITRFCGLQSKVYGLECAEEDFSCKKAKGIPKSVINKSLRFAHYMSSLFDNEIHYFSSNVIRSQNQVLYTMIMRKKRLQPVDDKRWILNHPSQQTLALGHYQIPFLNYIYENILMH